MQTPLDCKQPFSFREILDFMLGTPGEPLFSVTQTEVTRALNIQGQKILIRITENQDQPVLEFLTPPSQEVKLRATAYVREWFDIDRDLEPFYDMAHGDSLLRHPAQKYHGLRLVGIPDLFEALSWAIVGQQVNLSFAMTQKRRLAEEYGDFLEHEGQRHLIFPAPERIARLEPEVLLPLQISRRKGEYLIGIAREIVAGRLSKELLLPLSPQEAEGQLTALRGIGPWTANYVMMKTLRVQCALPADDVGLQNAIRMALGTKTKPTREEVLALGRNWQGWEAYATYYLWRTLYGKQN